MKEGGRCYGVTEKDEQFILASSILLKG